MTSQDEDSDVKGEDLNVMAYFKQETKNVDKKCKVPNNDLNDEIKIDLTILDYLTLPLHTNYLLDETSCSFITS